MRRQYAEGNYSNFKEFQWTEQTYKINEAVTCYVFPKINDLTTLEVRYSHSFGSVKWSHSRKNWKTWFFHWTTRAIVCWPLVRFWNFPILFKSNVENKCNLTSQVMWMWLYSFIFKISQSENKELYQSYNYIV